VYVSSNVFFQKLPKKVILRVFIALELHPKVKRLSFLVRVNLPLYHQALPILHRGSTVDLAWLCICYMSFYHWWINNYLNHLAPQILSTRLPRHLDGMWMVTFPSSNPIINKGRVSSCNVNASILFLLRVDENDFPFIQVSPSWLLKTMLSVQQVTCRGDCPLGEGSHTCP